MNNNYLNNNQNQRTSNNLIGVLYLDTKYPLMKNLYDTMKLMTPELLEKIKILDLKNIPSNKYPNLVLKYKQLPLLIAKDMTEPLIGPENIKRWLAKSYSPNSSSKSKSNDDYSNQIKQEQNSNMMYEGFSANMFGYNSTQYSSFETQNNNKVESNYELLNYDPKVDISMEFMKKTSSSNSSSNDKKDDLTKRMNILENQRKSLMNGNSQNNGVVSIN